MGTTGEAHDRLVNHLFGSGLTLAAVLNLQRLDSEVAQRVRDVVDQLDVAIREIRHLALAAAVPEHDQVRLRGAPTQPDVETRPDLVSPKVRQPNLSRFEVGSEEPLYYERA